MEATTHRGIADLPVELIRHICCFLYPTCDSASQSPHPCPECIHARPGCVEWYRGQLHVSRLSRTCRRLRDIVQPLVFLCSSDNGAHQLRRLARLARTLISRPDLAQQMRVVMLHDPFDDLDPDDRQFIQESIAHLGLPPVPDNWNLDDDEHSHRLLPLELVLLHAPNLEHLRLPLDRDWELNILSQAQLLPTQTHGRFSLPNLHSLQVSHFFTAIDRFDINMAAIATIQRAAPNIESLRLRPTPPAPTVPCPCPT